MASGRLILPNADGILEGSPALPISGATLTVKIAGSPTLASLFADAALSVDITNPQTSNAAGLFYAQSTVIWVDASQAYDCVLTLPDGTSWTYQNLYVLGAGADISGLAPINSPLFTGNPRAPTTALNDNSASLATTAYVAGQGYAPLASPGFSGVPTAPTAAPGTNTTQLATTAFATAAAGVTAPTSTTSGYFKIGGVILQWTPFSLGAAGGATQAVTWPLAFPTAVIGLPWIAVANAALEMIGVNAATTTGATIQKGATDTFARTGTVWAFGN